MENDLAALDDFAARAASMKYEIAACAAAQQAASIPSSTPRSGQVIASRKRRGHAGARRHSA
jgi:hypothetical protein